MSDIIETLGDGGRLERRLDPIGRWVRTRTYPLFKPDGRRMPQLVGCSVGLDVGGDTFLLTARHVVVDLKMDDFHVWTPRGWVEARGRIARTEPPRLKPDPLDAAVIKLEGAGVDDRLRGHLLQMTDLDLQHRDVPASHLMQLVGYPGGEVEVPAPLTLSPTWFQWAGVSAQEADYKKRGKTVEAHAVFHFDRRQALNPEGEKHPGPDLSGASGSGLWRTLPVPEDLERERWSLLSGIFTDYEGRTIIGTRVSAHMSLIERFFPGSVEEHRRRAG